MEGLEAILDDDHDEDTRRKLAALSSTASVSIVKDPAFVQTFRELPGLINSAPAPVRKTESHVSPPWATELIGKLDKVPLEQLDSEFSSSDVVWLKTTSTVGDALYFLRKFRVTGAPVFKDDECWGMLELADIMTVLIRSPRPSFWRVFRGDDDPANPMSFLLKDVINFDEKSAFLINSSFFADSLIDAFRHQWRVGIYSKDRLLSVVSQKALMKNLVKGGLGKICSRTNVIAAGLVVSPVFSCDEEDSAGLVMAAMSGHKINAVAVTQHGHFVGALSSHVLLHLENMEELSMPVGKLLAKHRAVIDPVLTCGPRDSVADVLKKFESGNAHRVFVVDRKNAIGVITLSSLFRCMFDAKAANRSDTMGSVNILK